MHVPSIGDQELQVEGKAVVTVYIKACHWQWYTGKLNWLCRLLILIPSRLPVKVIDVYIIDNRNLG